ncbi:hypothetical protein Hamer_G019132 [Homarus americanus]|uniref:Uncharacterized protein n=1 Tax=Homarus americanus TaxID=6706 RepID=A0A8J5JTB1_HOMAM|nr:hypothetical protein Hamer_G019132 [Homarus americanus]
MHSSWAVYTLSTTACNRPESTRGDTFSSTLPLTSEVPHRPPVSQVSDIESEDENESATLEPSATPGPSSATQGPSSTPAHILTVKQFWNKFNIRNAVDTMVDSWHEINVPKITHAWTPLFPHLKVECGGASGAQQLDNGSLLAETVESVRRVGGEFAEVTEDTVMNLVTFNSEENITEMLQNDSDSSSDKEGQPEVIEKLTTAKLEKILTECSDMKESLQKFTQDAPELQNALP